MCEAREAKGKGMRCIQLKTVDKTESCALT